jgi:hypothetical protein
MLPPLLKFVVAVLLAKAAEETKSGGQWVEVLKVTITALGPIVAAVIVSIAGAWITHRYAAQRARAEQDAINTRHANEITAENTRHANEIKAENARHANELAAIAARQEKELEVLQKRYEFDRESAWRSHAIELAKLEMQRKLEEWKTKPDGQKNPIWPSTMDFLAAYRDLQELNDTPPGVVWQRIYTQRIARPRASADPAPPVVVTEGATDQAGGRAGSGEGDVAGTGQGTDVDVGGSLKGGGNSG